MWFRKEHNGGSVREVDVMEVGRGEREKEAKGKGDR